MQDSKKPNFSVEFPEVRAGEISQDEEFMVVEDQEAGKRKIRFHDYHEIFEIPGLYEYLFYEKLQCKSPKTICTILGNHVREAGGAVDDLVVLDVGAGNGMVGERLSHLGVKSVVGVDIIEEAALATQRDRPDIYDDYYVVDLTQMPEGVRRELQAKDFNCLVTVSALGFGDIPPAAFAEAFNLVSAPGWIAFNIKDTFLLDEDPSGFAKLIDRISETGIMEPHSKERYCHRLSMDGEPLYYFAIVGEKTRDIPAEWVNGAS